MSGDGTHPTITSRLDDVLETGVLAAAIDPSVAHPGRMYDYLLGGTTNFAADRAAVDAGAVVVGGIEFARQTVRSNRAFLVRAVRWLATEAGVRQFMDIGTGIPTPPTVHEVAQATAPESRIVYVDNDPIVLAHAHLLMQSAPEGATTYINGDLREADPILKEAAEALDFTRPVAVLLVAILHFFPDCDDPLGIVARLIDAVPSGSYLVVSHLASDIQADEMAQLAERFAADEMITETFVMRARTEVARFFDGLDLVAPGVVGLDDWRPDDATGLPSAGWVNPFWCGIGVKP
ncbi:MAG: SAM-dependent methyltransferase [Acidimicrobiales bacterium]